MAKLESKLGFEKRKITVIGDLMLDTFLDGSVERISPEAPVPIMRVESEKYFPGGAANVANNIRALGAEVSLFGFIGKDEAGNKLSLLLKEAGIKFMPAYSEKTTEKIRISPAGHQLIRLDRESENKKFFADYHDLSNEIRESDIIVVSDYAKGVVTNQLMDFLRSTNKKILVDPRPKNLDLYKGVFLVTPNEKEAFEMANDKNPRNSAQIIRQQLGSNVIITRGKEGMLIYDGIQIKEIPTFAREVFDVTGAGDTAIAALALSLGSGKNLEDSAIISNHAAGIVVGKRGTATVSLSELESKLFAESGKVKTIDQLQEISKNLQTYGKKVVWTNGCFDLLHPGHIEYLQEAHAQGDVLIVGINSDNSVKSIKGPNRPILTQDERAKTLSALDFVDFISINDSNDFTEYLKALKPNIYVKGGDYTLQTINQVERKIVEAYGGKIVIAKLKPGISTSTIISRIKNGYE